MKRIDRLLERPDFTKDHFSEAKGYVLQALAKALEDHWDVPFSQVMCVVNTEVLRRKWVKPRDQRLDGAYHRNDFEKVLYMDTKAVRAAINPTMDEYAKKLPDVAFHVNEVGLLQWEAKPVATVEKTDRLPNDEEEANDVAAANSHALTGFKHAKQASATPQKRMTETSTEYSYPRPDAARKKRFRRVIPETPDVEAERMMMHARKTPMNSVELSDNKQNGHLLAMSEKSNDEPTNEIGAGDRANNSGGENHPEQRLASTPSSNDQLNSQLDRVSGSISERGTVQVKQDPLEDVSDLKDDTRRNRAGRNSGSMRKEARR